MKTVPANNRLIPVILVLALFTAGTQACGGKTPEAHVEPVLEHILETRQAILKQMAAQGSACSQEDCLFLAVWDFDGTIIDGDISEGLKRNGRSVYKGLLQVAIEKGFARAYQGVDAFPRFWLEYKAMEARDAAAAYGFLPRIVAGSHQRDINGMAAEYFSEVLRKHYFHSSRTIFEKINASGVRNYIISAAPHVFVENAADSLNLERHRIHGIRTRIRDGIIGDEIVEPITYHRGKTETLRNIVARLKQEQPGRRVFVLAGFGNSYHTDADFLKYIVREKLPAGKPISVMINGGTTPAEYRDLFKLVEQKQVTGE